ADHVAVAGADEAVAAGDGADDATGAVAPGGGAEEGVVAILVALGALPRGAGDDVVAVGKDRNAAAGVEVATDGIVGRRADQAVAGRDGAIQTGEAVDPGHGTGGAVPVWADDEEVTAGQRDDAGGGAAADAVIGLAAGQGADQRTGVAVEEINGAGV